MYDTKNYDLFGIFLNAYRIRHIQLSAAADSLSAIDFKFRGQIYQDFDYAQLFSSMTAHAIPNFPIEYIDDLGLHYFIACMIESETTYHILGPFLFQSPSFLESDDDLVSFLEKNNIHPRHASQIKNFFARITVISDQLACKYLYEAILEKSAGTAIHLLTVTFRDTKKDAIARQSISASDTTLDYDAFEARYDVENKMLDAIAAGDTQNALYYLHLFRGFTLKVRTENPIRSAKDYIISANTAFRKAAERACVHPLYIDRLSGRFIEEIEHADTFVQLDNLNANMVRKYCLLVRSYSRAQYSPLIRNCLNYIDFNFTQPLSLLFFAEKYAVSKNYLSTLFHREVKVTMTEYINTARIRHAIMLLNTTDLSMQTISEQCGFSDANYFTRTFKKIQGMSPLKYRQSLLG